MRGLEKKDQVNPAQLKILAHGKGGQGFSSGRSTSADLPWQLPIVWRVLGDFSAAWVSP